MPFIKNKKEVTDQFEVLRKLNKKDNTTQRSLSLELGYSLGKINYCLKALQKKGYVKLENFKKQKEKIKYLRYVITPKGISFRTTLALNFMKKKLKEYDELKKELERIENEK